MKIRTDVNEILPQKSYVPSTRIQSAPDIRNNQPTRADIRPNQVLTDRLNMESSLNDALNIAVMSQSIIQKAMVVTSRLRSIAAEAINTGLIKTDEVQAALADIQSSIQAHGERITAPPPMSAGRNFDLPPLPAIGSDLQAVADTAQGMQKGNIPATGTLQSIQENLIAKSSDLNTAIKGIESSLTSLAKTYPVQGNFNAQRTVPETSGLIMSNPQNALSIQGNISRENAVRILGG